MVHIHICTVKPRKPKHPQEHQICSNNRCTLWDVSNMLICYMYMTSVSYQSSLLKEIIKLHDLFTNNLIKKENK